MGNQDKEVAMPPQPQALKLRRFPVRRLFKNISHVSMRNLATVALLLFGSMTVARSDVLTYTAVPVTGVNQKAHSFSVRWMDHAKSTHTHGTQIIGRSSRSRTPKLISTLPSENFDHFIPGASPLRRVGCKRLTE